MEAPLHQAFPWRPTVGLAVVLTLALAACGSADEPEATPTVSFDGGTCTYVGPDTFEANTLPGFEVINTSEFDFEFALFEVDDSVSAEAAATGVQSWVSREELPTGIAPHSSSGPVAPGGQRSVNVPFTDSARFMPSCLTMVDEISEREGYLAAEFITVG